MMEMAKDEVQMLFGVTGEMEKMGVKLGDLKNFLADADRRNINDNTVQAWVGQLKRAMYEATDILDLCQLKAMKRVPSRADEGAYGYWMQPATDGCYGLLFLGYWMAAY
jgi:hypothetical protein